MGTVAATTLVGCSHVPEIGMPSGEAPIAAFALTAQIAHGHYFHQTLEWTSCDDGSSDQCAELSAPVDWTGRDPGSIRLALLKHPATGTRLGSLIVNPGGPGESATELVGGALDHTVTTSVAEHFDVIGLDPRGVGASTAVNCGGPTAIDHLLYDHLPGAVGSAEWVSADLARSRDFAHACRQKTGALLDHIDTVSAAQDLELVRAALHETKLNYLGYSYGSYLGTVYAGLYPTRVGRFVLDGADDPWYEDGEIGKNGKEIDDGDGTDGTDGSADGIVDQARGFDGALSHYLDACLAADPAALGGAECPFTGSRHAAQSTIEGELASAATHPLAFDDGRFLDGAVLATAISQALYDPTQWPDLTKMFTQVAGGDPTEAFALADAYNGRNDDGSYDGNTFEANLAIDCLESGGDYDLIDDRAEFRELKHDAPVLGPYFGFADLQCAGWRGPAAWPDPIFARGAGPIVVISTTGDPATPYDEGVALAHQLASGHLISFHGDGHTAYDLGHACVDQAVDAYMVTGTAPVRDPQCH